MPESVFNFKQFSVRHRDSAMKVGVDAVLLGAWATAENPKHILDIGSGTGIIGMMLAQRFEKAKITAVEIMEEAFNETVFNYQNSPFSDRFSAVHAPIQSFKSNIKFDLIVSNPPFFDPTHTDHSARSKARQQHLLNFDELLKTSSKLLSDNGHCAYIVPYSAGNHFIQTASLYGLIPKRIMNVRGNPVADFKRSMLLFSKTKTTLQTDALTIEHTRNVFTDDYIRLTKDFYLKM
ncbi:MAG: methyltransferase [Weeksellaceae bacterium]|nr:methyltransferase [Weeksellaceae bacterium]